MAFNVREHGAMGDGSALDGPAVQRAMDRCSESGGGAVVFPAGTYLTGTLHRCLRRRAFVAKMIYGQQASQDVKLSGYWGCLAVACEVDRRRVIPLHQRLWSAEAPDFVSENAQLLKISEHHSAVFILACLPAL